MRIAFLLLIIANYTIEAAAQSVSERIARDELAVVDDNDPLMVAAIQKGRATLPGFLKLANAPAPSMSHFSVKVPIRAGDRFEYFWISNFRKQDGQYSGRLNNTPRWATHLNEGDTVTFAEREIIDWMYIQNGRMKGNFTFCAILQREPENEAHAVIRRFGLECKR